MFEILLVDDEPQLRFTIRKFLETRGYGILEADSCQSALETCRNTRPDAIVLDYNLPDGDALGLLPSLQEIHPDIPILILTAHATVDLAVRAMKQGAENFLTKPVELPTLHIILERALENQRNRVKVAANESRIAREFLGAFLGQGQAIRRLANLAEGALRTEVPVLIQGETGSGKGTLAMWLHQKGARSKEAIVDLNCAGLSRELLESELFGHEKGAFTGAERRRVGRFEAAHEGTLFLDEVGELAPASQAKLLRAIETSTFEPVGSSRSVKVDVRVLSATNRDLGAEVRRGAFRRDLYYRLNVIDIHTPPLRERRADVPLLVRAFLDEIAARSGKASPQLSPEVTAA
ncbi:MAG TPA: sigma-54 dependent transcriptional regulator, partial [Terriglobia bacterium]|nr:sigma-54 dependent transcriptional regulator [Terriglobia bacterium]